MADDSRRQRESRRRAGLVVGLICAAILSVASIYLAVMFDRFGGATDRSLSQWPATAALLSLALFFLAPVLLRGELAGAVLGFGAMGLGYLLAPGPLTNGTVALVIGMMALIVPIIAALNGRFRRFHRGLSWAALPALLVGFWFLTRVFLAWGTAGELAFAMPLFVPLLLCVYPASLCAGFIEPDE